MFCSAFLLCCFPAADAVHGFSFGFPLDLEIGFGVEEAFVGPWEYFELAEGLDLLAGVVEVFLVIGHEEEFAVGFEGGFDGM